MAMDLESIAAEMMAAQEAGYQVEPVTDRFPGFDLHQAYAVAALIHRAKQAGGANPVGRKIGFTNPDMWARYGVREPIWAYVYDTTVVHLQDVQTMCSLGNFCEPRIEPEIVFALRNDLAPPVQLADIVRAIDWVAHGFEIVQSHFPGWRFQAADTIVDCSLHATLLVGPRRPLSMLGKDPVAALEDLSIDLLCDGDRVETGKGSNVLGNPLAAMVHLVALLDSQPGQQPLKAGEIVSTGTMTSAPSVKPGQRWHSRVSDSPLAGLAVDFVS